MTDMRFGQDCGWQPIGIQRHAFDIRCLSACLGDWGCGRNYNTAHIVGRLRVLSDVYMVLLWKAASPGFSIYIFINHRSHREAAQRSLSNANAFSPLAHNTHTAPLQYIHQRSSSQHAQPVRLSFRKT